MHQDDGEGGLAEDPQNVQEHHGDEAGVLDEDLRDTDGHQDDEEGDPAEDPQDV